MPDGLHLNATQGTRMLAGNLKQAIGMLSNNQAQNRPYGNFYNGPRGRNRGRGGHGGYRQQNIEDSSDFNDNGWGCGSRGGFQRQNMNDNGFNSRPSGRGRRGRISQGDLTAALSSALINMLNNNN